MISEVLTQFQDLANRHIYPQVLEEYHNDILWQKVQFLNKTRNGKVLEIETL